MKPEKSEFIERVVRISRVAKVVKGGKRFSFSALVVAGNGQGRVGVGLGKAQEVPEAIRKGIERAKKQMVDIPVVAGGTIPFAVYGHSGAGRIIIKPAAPGTGVKAGGAARAVMEAAGVKNVLSKSLGSPNPLNVVQATMDALEQLKTPRRIAELRGKSLHELFT